MTKLRKDEFIIVRIDKQLKADLIMEAHDLEFVNLSTYIRSIVEVRPESYGE